MLTRLEKLRRIAAQQPDDPFVHYGIGLELFHQEQWADAIAAFDQALTHDPKYVPALMQKSQAELKLGQRDAARQSLTNAVATARENGDDHTADELNKMLETLN